MGLLSILRKLKIKEREMRLLMLGLDNAGKTSIVKKFNGEEIDTISPTLGFNIKTLDYKINVWDVGGQKSIRSYWKNYFEQTDSADVTRLGDWKVEFSKLLKEERLSGASLLVFANKQDLPGALSADEIKEFLGLDHLVKRHWSIVPCSAVTGQGLDVGIGWVVHDVAARVFVE